MRGFVEPRTLATVISRSRSPCCNRSYSNGIGRGRGGGFGSYPVAEESLLGDGSYGHGVPLDSPSAGRGGPLHNAGRGGHARGYNGPLVSNVSLGRGSGFQRPEEQPPLKPPPSLNLGTSAFGRGKPLEKAESQEELFSTERKGILSSWSKWDEKAKKFSPMDRASPAELRLLGEDEPSNVLPSLGAPQQHQQLGQTRGLQSSPGVPPPWPAPDQQPSSISPQTEWHSPPGIPPPRAPPIQQPVSQPPGVGVPLQPPPFQQPEWQYSGGFQPSPAGLPGWQSPGGGLPIQSPPGVPPPWPAPDQQPSSVSPRAEWHSPPGVPPPRASPIQQPTWQPPRGGVPRRPPPFQQPGWQYSGGFQPSPVGPPDWQAPGGGIPIQAPPGVPPPWPAPDQRPSSVSPRAEWRSPPGVPPPRASPIQQPAWQPPRGGVPVQPPPFQQPGWQYSGGFQPSPVGPLDWQTPGGGFPIQSLPGVPLPWPAPDQQPSSVSSRAEWRSPPVVPPPRASPIQQPAWQPPRGGVPVRPPPFQQPGWQYSGGFQPSPVGPPDWQAPGGGIPIQAPPQQAEVPGRQVRFDPRAQPRPFSSHVPPTTGWQQQPPQDPYVQPQPSMDYSAPSTDWQQQAASMEEYSDKFADGQAKPSGFEAAQAYNTGAPSQSSISESEWVQGGQGSLYSEPYSVNQEAHQPAWAESTYEMSRQAPVDHQLEDWSHGSTSDTMQGITGPQDLSQQGQGQYLFRSGVAQAPSATSQHSSEASSYDYDWGKPTQEELTSSDVSIHADAGLDYDRRIEECYEQGKLEDMDAIFGEMKAGNIRASPNTYDTLMRSYIQLQRMDKVSEVYMEMRRDVVPDDKSRSDKVKESPIMATGGAHQDREEQESDLRKLEAATSFTSTKGSVTSGSSSPSAKLGMGRGKKVGGFFDFDFSGSLGVGGESSEVHQEVKPEIPDDYSQTFKPVMQPGLLNFTQEGLSVGPGAGRGRPQSPQAREFEFGSGLSFQPRPFDLGSGRGTTSSYSYGEDMQQEPPRYSMDRRAQQYDDYSPVPSEPSLDEDEAAERAMNILNQRMSKRYSRLQEWQSEVFDDDEPAIRRSPIQLAQAKVPKEKKQRKKPAKLKEEEKQLMDEASKERLEAIEQNETIAELQGILDSFMKCYGEMALEPEHELGDFTNPDIDEKPPMSLEEYLEKAKPNIMKTGLIAGEKQWQRMVEEALKNADHFEEFVERHSGPGRYTAKEENDDLEEIANMLPLDVSRGSKDFVQRSLITLKSNPGFNLDEKQWMLANMVDTFAQFPARTRTIS